jgi:DNA modification methylase
MLATSLRDVGPARSIVIDENDHVLAGNGVVTAATQVGLTKLRVVEPDDDEIVAVRRRGLTPEKKRALAIYDNRVAELAEWDVDQLARDRAAGLELVPFWTEPEQAAIFARRDRQPGLVDPEATPAPRATTTIQRGDLFALGRHRLLCGDATSAADVAKLLEGVEPPTILVTDPPYGVEYDASWRAKAGVNRNREKLGKVQNDDRADWREAFALFPGRLAYVWHAGLKASTVQASLEAAGFELRAQIVWAKDRLVLSRGDYHWQHEPCWYGVRGHASAGRTKDRAQTTLWEIASTLWRIPAREDVGHGHSTQKPVECMARPMRNHLALVAYDPFIGSGTTIIAAEQMRRTCYGIELDPIYVQVALERWQAFTGERPTPIGTPAAATGRRRRSHHARSEA